MSVVITITAGEYVRLLAMITYGRNDGGST